MSMYSRSGHAAVTTESRPAALELEVRGRWDALALSRILIPYHSFLVQHDEQRWVVHARAPGCHGEPLEAALHAAAEWAEEHETEIAACRVGGRPYQLGESE
jgi:hypothetical protein